jgi:hypothetical protein
MYYRRAPDSSGGDYETKRSLRDGGGRLGIDNTRPTKEENNEQA